MRRAGVLLLVSAGLLSGCSDGGGSGDEPDTRFERVAAECDYPDYNGGDLESEEVPNLKASCANIYLHLSDDPPWSPLTTTDTSGKGSYEENGVLVTWSISESVMGQAVPKVVFEDLEDLTWAEHEEKYPG